MNPTEIALSLARGCYQRAIVTGRARLSGADLRGRARKWSASYARSRAALLRRLRADARLVVREERGAHGLRILTIEAHAKSD